MARGNFADHAITPIENKQEKDVLGHGKCVIYGCPRMGHINTGVWNCRYHFNYSGDQLAKVTTVLRNHNADFNWYEETLTWTCVDYEYSKKQNDAPDHLKVFEGENYLDYKKRMAKHIDNLLPIRRAAMKRAPILSKIEKRKDNSFGSFSESIDGAWELGRE